MNFGLSVAGRWWLLGIVGARDRFVLTRNVRSVCTSFDRVCFYVVPTAVSGPIRD